MKFLIVGLGNIGGEYNDTRHNIGFDVVDHLAVKYDGQWTSDRLADICSIKFKGRTLILIKPTTYMNLSGRAVLYWQQKEKIKIENTLVVVDDLALDLDCLRLKGSGSPGGHNGLENIQEVLNSNKFPRLRFGIGNDFSKGRQSDFVLGKWREKEVPLVLEKISMSLSVIESFVTQGIGRTMNQWNNKKASLEPKEKSEDKEKNKKEDSQ